MSVTRSYFRSSVFILLAMIAGKAASFFWKIILLRSNVSLLGEIEVFLTTVGLAVTFSTLAFPAAVTRFALRKKSKAFSFFLHGLLQSCLVFLVVSVALWAFSRTGLLFTAHTHIPFFALVAVVFVSVAQEFSLAFLNSQKKFTLYGIGEYVLTPLLKLGLLLLIFFGVLSKNFLFTHVVWATVIGAVVVGALPFLKRKASISASLTLAEQQTFRSYSLFLTGSFLSFMVYSALDVYFLQYFFNSALVGIYVGMLTLINLLDLLFLPFLHTLPARLSEETTAQKRIVVTKNTTRLLLKWGLLLGAVGTLLSSSLLPIISNHTVEISIGIIGAFMLFKVVDSSLVLVYRHYFDFQGQQDYTAKTMLLSLVVKAVLCLVLVKPWGLAGLAVGNISTDLFHTWLLVRRMRAAK